MKRENEHSQVARVELEIGDSTTKDMAENVLVCNSEHAHLKGGVQHTNGVASTDLKGEGNYRKVYAYRREDLYHGHRDWETYFSIRKQVFLG